MLGVGADNLAAVKNAGAVLGNCPAVRHSWGNDCGVADDHVDIT